MAPVRYLVVLANAEPSATDSLAALLRDTATVRTAYSTEEVLDRLDPEVDVTLVDPQLDGNAVAAVGDAVADRALDCQVGLLSTDPEAADGIDHVDAVVSPAASEDDFRGDVTRLATQARYRKTLDEYYELARASARLRGDGDRQAERERLQARLDRLGRRLDEVAEHLDAAMLFRAVLDSECDDREHE